MNGRRVIIVMALLMAALVIGVTVTAYFSVRDRVQRKWADQLSTMSLMMAEQASQTMFSAHTVLDSIDSQISAAHVDNEDAYRRLAGTKEMHELLVSRTASNPIIDVVSLVASNGQVLNFTRSYPAPLINLAERDYFRAHSADPRLDYYTSVPVRNKGNGKWVFYISRPVRDGQGHLLGLILVGVSVEWISQFYERIGASLGTGASLSMWRSDFTLMTRWPFVEDQVGRVMLNTGTHKVIAEQKLDHGIVMNEGLREFGATATVTRMTAPRVVPRYPFIVTAAVSDDYYLDNLRIGVVWIFSTAAITLVLIGLGTRSLLRADTQLRRELNDRVRAQDALRVAHEQLEVRVAERTVDLRHEITEREQAQQALASLNEHIAAVSHRAGMAEVVNSVLHNVGNVLNSVNVSVTMIGDQLRQSAMLDLPRAVALLQAHEHDLPDYLSHDAQGRQLAGFLALLAEQWQREHQLLTDESSQLSANVQHIKDIVSRQQSLSGMSGMVSTIDLPALVDDVLTLHAGALQRGGLHLLRNHHGPTQWQGDRSKLTQILLNLVVNAEESLSAMPDVVAPRCLAIRCVVSDDLRLEIEVQDNGSGVAPEALSRLFAYG